MARRPPKQDKPLPHRQWLFCQEYVFGRYAGQAGRCYLLSHFPPNENGEYPELSHSHGINGNNLLKKPAVKAELDRCREQLARQENLSPDNHMNDLRRLRDKAEESGDIKGAIKAEELRGKVMGYYVERHQHLHADVTESQLLGELASLLKQEPALARQLIAEFGEVVPVEALPDKVEA